MKMKPADKKEYEALTSLEERAKWLLRKGVTAKPTIHPERLDITVRAYAAGVMLPGEWDTTEAAIAGATAWLAEKAGVQSASDQRPGPR